MNERKIQLVIPMAGLGQRFVDANYTILKPLIPIHGVPMIKLVIDNLMSDEIGHVILIAQRETIEDVDLREILKDLSVPLTIVAVESLTQGPADTVCLAKPVLNNNFPMVIANSDQFINAKLAWDAFSTMWEKNDRTNGEFYVAPAYNYVALAGVPINLINLGPISSVIFGLGTPHDLEQFIDNPLSKKAAEASRI